MKDRYTPEEVDAILRTALERAPLPGEMTREQLVQLAAEVGVSEADLARAEAETLNRPRQDALFQAFLEERRARRVALVRLAIVLSLFFVILNAATDDSEFWAIFPILAIWLAPAIAWARGGTKENLRHSRSYARWLLARGIPVVPGDPVDDLVNRLRR
jgi:hypothetical protein